MSSPSPFLPVSYVKIAPKPVAAPLPLHAVYRPLPQVSSSVIALQLAVIAATPAALFAAVAVWA